MGKGATQVLEDAMPMQTETVLPWRFHEYYHVCMQEWHNLGKEQPNPVGGRQIPCAAEGAAVAAAAVVLVEGELVGLTLELAPPHDWIRSILCAQHLVSTQKKVALWKDTQYS